MNIKKRLAICSAVVAAALLLPAANAAADHRHDRRHHHHSGVSVSVGVGAYPVYGSYYFDPYYDPAPAYRYYSYPAYGEVYYRPYRYYSRPSVGVYLGW